MNELGTTGVKWYTVVPDSYQELQKTKKLFLESFLEDFALEIKSLSEVITGSLTVSGRSKSNKTCLQWRLLWFRDTGSVCIIS